MPPTSLTPENDGSSWGMPPTVWAFARSRLSSASPRPRPTASSNPHGLTLRTFWQTTPWSPLASDRRSSMTSSEHWEDALVSLVHELDQTGQIDLYEFYTTTDTLHNVALVVNTLS